jgi:sialate O-acetylesterase
MFTRFGHLAFAILALSAASVRAEVRLASPFTSHMVLQRQMSVPVWGTAGPGETVTVSFAGQTKSATADSSGNWRVDLGPLDTSDVSRTFTVTGSKTAQPIQLDDVLVGEVWLASGQSNMDFSISQKVKYFAGVANEDQEIAAANYPDIRILTGTAEKMYDPQTSVPGEWVICSPQSAPAFSAVAYFFARDLQKGIKMPVGIITMAFGASTAEAWIRREALEADPQLSPMLQRFDTAVKYFQDHPPAVVATPPPEDVSAATPAASAIPGASATPRARRPRDPNPIHDQHNPTVLFNGMINPIIPYAMRGVIWYQGESIVGGTAGRALYPLVQATLVRDWRKLWGEGDFPFYICQLAALNNNSNNPWVREAQTTILKLPNTGMAVTIDIGDPKNVHPKDKQDVGDRLSRIALANVYGQKIEYSGPVYDSMKIENGAIRISFTHLGGGLVAKGGPLKTFVIAGSDGKFVPADATIDGDTVVVSSPSVSSPAAARYAWENYPDGCNLYNAAGLPAPPFRTDTYEK